MQLGSRNLAAKPHAEHFATHVSTAELFYLRHSRSCAASAHGKRGTSSGATPGLCISGELVVLELIVTIFMAVLQSTLLMLEFALSMFMAVLQNVPSPLEFGACIVVVDAIEHECRGVRNALAVLVLFLAACSYH